MFINLQYQYTISIYNINIQYQYTISSIFNHLCLIFLVGHHYRLGDLLVYNY